MTKTREQDLLINRTRDQDRLVQVACGAAEGAGGGDAERARDLPKSLGEMSLNQAKYGQVINRD